MYHFLYGYTAKVAGTERGITRTASHVPGVPSEVLSPRNMSLDGESYNAQARKLAALFAKNFERFEPHASPAVRAVAIKPGMQ